LPNPSGFGGGGTIGFELVKGFALVGSFDYRSIKSRTWDTTNNSISTATGGALTGTYSVSTSNTTNTMILGIGFRPSVQALGGSIYAGFGFAYVLPYDSVTTSDISASTNALFALTQQKTTASKNAGIGVYGELGYNFPITDNLYVGLGFRAVVATANNDGKSSVTTKTGTVGGAAQADTTTNYSSTSGGTGFAKYTSTGITDAGVNVNVGIRF